MRVLYAAAETDPPTYPSVNAIFGHGLTRAGHDVVGMFYDEDGPSGVTWPGEVVRVPRPRRRPVTRVAASVWREWRAIDRVLATVRPFDVVIVRDDPLMASAAIRRRGRHGRVIYQISHLNPEETFEHAERGIYGPRLANVAKGSVTRYLRDRALARADHAIVMTDEMRRALSLAASRTSVIGEGVARDWRADITAAAMRAWLGVGEAPLLTYAGTFNRVRRIEVIVEAHAEILRARADAVLVLAGRGREAGDEEVLRARAVALGIADSVRFVGAIRHERVAALFDAADVVLSPFANTPVLRCNSPTRLFEAMHRARPIVAGDIPEQRRVVGSADCGVVVSHEASAIATAALALLGDEQRRRELGARGRAWVLEHRTYERLASDVDRLIRDVGR